MLPGGEIPEPEIRESPRDETSKMINDAVEKAVRHEREMDEVIREMDQRVAAKKSEEPMTATVPEMANMDEPDDESITREFALEATNFATELVSRMQAGQDVQQGTEGLVRKFIAKTEDALGTDANATDLEEMYKNVAKLRDTYDMLGKADAVKLLAAALAEFKRALSELNARDAA